MHNPYNFSQPAEVPLFVGRDAVVEKIAANLSGARTSGSWALIGGRNFGKRSALKRLNTRLLEGLDRPGGSAQRVFPVVVHLMACESQSERNIYVCILRELSKRLSQRPEAGGVLGRTALSALLSAGGEECSFYRFQEVLDDLTRKLEEGGSRVRLALLLDEVEKVMRYDWRDTLFDKLRYLVYDSDLVDRVSLVLTGSTRVAQARANGSPLLNALHIEQLEPLARADIDALLALGGGAPPEAAEAIHAQCGGHPYIAQYLLHLLWDGGLGHLTPARVEAAAVRMRHERAAELQSWWEDIGEMGQRAYALLAESDAWQHESTLQDRVHDPLLPLDQALAALSYHGLATRDESRESYRYLGSLFRTWVMLNKKPARIAPRAAPVPPAAGGAITWLHVSDIHFKEAKGFDPDVVLSSLLRDLRECMEGDGLRPDFIAVTGDIAFSGKPAEYAHARVFFDELLAATDLTRDRVFVVPGNHDADRKLISRSASLTGRALTSRKDVNLILESPEDRRLHMARFKGYAEFVNDYFPHLAFDDERYFYVRFLDLAGQRVALLGLNSSWLAESDEDEKLRLVLGERQVRTALDAARKAGLKVALFHHPFKWLRDFDHADSGSMLADNCDFLLHGHMHHAGLQQLGGPDGAALVIAGGACYEAREHPNSFNFVRLDFGAGEGAVYLWRYTDERGGFWVRDNALYKNVSDGVYRFDLPERLRRLPAAAGG